MDFVNDFPWEQAIFSGLFAVIAVLVAYLLVKVFSKIPLWANEEDEPSPPEEKDEPSGMEEDDELPAIDADLPPAVKVMVLGLEGSGKTMMMAGMYHRWAFGGQHGVVLRAHGAAEELLSRLVAKINDLDGGLPESTRDGDMAKADFTFMVNTVNNGVRRSFSLRYIDYAGEQIRRVLFPAENPPPDSKVKKDLAEADILLGVLDGGHIARAMRNDPPRDFAKILAGLMIYLANAERKTIHVVISKWDLLVDENGDSYALFKVIEFLNRYHSFCSFCQNSPAVGVRRIIPISTFGLNGFIRVDHDGAVYKNRAVPWHPFMAENAVACSVPDVLQTEFERAAETYQITGQVDARRPVKALAPFLKLMPAMLNSFTGIRIVDTNGMTYGELIEIWRTCKDRIGMRPDKTEYPDDGRELSRPEAILRVSRLFTESVRELERQFPESKIDRPRGGADRLNGWPER